MYWTLEKIFDIVLVIASACLVVASQINLIQWKRYLKKNFPDLYFKWHTQKSLSYRFKKLLEKANEKYKSR